MIGALNPDPLPVTPARYKVLDSLKETLSLNII